MASLLINTIRKISRFRVSSKWINNIFVKLYALEFLDVSYCCACVKNIRLSSVVIYTESKKELQLNRVLSTSQSDFFMKNIVFLLHCIQVACAVLLGFLCSHNIALAADRPALQGSVGFWYASNPPLSELAQFDYLMLEPAHFDAAARDFLRTQNTQLFAYLSVGEFDGDKQALADNNLSASTSRVVNQAWNSHVMNLADEKWQNYLEARAKSLYEQGYNGLFLDTLDSFQLLPADQQEEQRQGLIDILTRLQNAVPELELVFNRGFEVVHELAKKPAAVAIESIYAGWDPTNNRYVPVNEQDRQWLGERIEPLRAKNIPIIAIEYLPVKRRAEARQLVKKLQSEGFIPYVGTPHLDTLGLSSIEIQPRRLALLYDERESDLTDNGGHVFLGGLLEYLGYRVDYFRIGQPLPSAKRLNLYAGVMTWSTSGPPVDSGSFYIWMNQVLDAQVPLVFFGSLPVENAALLERMGLRTRSGVVSTQLKVDQYDSTVLGHFEAPLQARTRGLQSLISIDDKNTILLQLSDASGRTYHPAVLAPWGGYAFNPYLVEGTTDHHRWILDPFTFLQKTLRLPHIPRVDSTTENGRRIATVHIDGDGFPSKAEIPGTPYAGQAVLDLFLKPYPLLSSVSVIEGEVGPKGKYPEISPTLEKIARQIFALDHVEVASHTFSHPFFWRPEIAQKREGFDPEYGYMMDIPGYDEIDYTREVVGSIDYINERLTTPEKPVKAMFWSGDALPSAQTLKLAYDKGVVNINGAVTAVKPSNPSLTGVHPLLRPTEEGMHYYAPIINENVYTNLWHGPFYGFRDVLFTYQFTDSPRRLRGLHLYYHFYSGTKQASIKTMEMIYQYMINAKPISLMITQYVARLQGLHEASLGLRSDGGWQIKGLNDLRTVRLDPEMGWPNMLKSQGVAGVRDLEQGRYVALSDNYAVLHLQKQRDATASLEQANIPLQAWRYKNANEIDFSFAGEFVLDFSVRSAQSCHVVFNDKRYEGKRNNDLITFNLPFKQVSHAKLICQ